MIYYIMQLVDSLTPFVGVSADKPPPRRRWVPLPFALFPLSLNTETRKGNERFVALFFLDSPSPPPLFVLF